jgi:hypothetical protein
MPKILGFPTILSGLYLLVFRILAFFFSMLGGSIYALRVAHVGIGLLGNCSPHYCKLSLFKTKYLNILKLSKQI